jgi:raffinose/stachyose/melibiose transport system permease protein
VRATRTRGAQRRFIGWLFLAPILFFNGVVILGPSVGSAYYAFTDWSGIGPAEFVGLENFARLLEDRVYRLALLNNLRYLAIFLTLPILMGLVGAALLATVKRFQLLFRILYFIPYVLPSVIIAFIWRGIFHPIYGVGAWLASAWGWEWANVKFFGNPDIVLYAIAFADNWHWWGFLVVIYLAAMQGVPPELYEAAEMDGATAWQRFWHITLPGIVPTLVFSVLITMIGSFLVFDYIYILTGGGPAHASEVLATEVYRQAFDRFEVGYAAAVGLTMTLLVSLVVLGFVWLRRRGWEI